MSSGQGKELGDVPDVLYGTMIPCDNFSASQSRPP